MHQAWAWATPRALPVARRDRHLATGAGRLDRLVERRARPRGLEHGVVLARRFRAGAETLCRPPADGGGGPRCRRPPPGRARRPTQVRPIVPPPITQHPLALLEIDRVGGMDGDGHRLDEVGGGQLQPVGQRDDAVRGGSVPPRRSRRRARCRSSCRRSSGTAGGRPPRNGRRSRSTAGAGRRRAVPSSSRPANSWPIVTGRLYASRCRSEPQIPDDRTRTRRPSPSGAGTSITRG